MQLGQGASCRVSSPGACCHCVSRLKEWGSNCPSSAVLGVLFLSRNGGVSSVFSLKKPKALHIYCYRPKQNSISNKIILEDKTKFKKIRYLVTKLANENYFLSYLYYIFLMPHFSAVDAATFTRQVNRAQWKSSDILGHCFKGGMALKLFQHWNHPRFQRSSEK